MRDDERGGITVLMLVLFIGILLLTGLALDLARHESERADLQGALDRGVLAATALNQPLEPEAVIADYLANRMLSDATVTPAIAEQDAINQRMVAAWAQYDMGTTFLRLVGLGNLDVVASSAAIESITNVEISLVLDISGTMRWAQGDNQNPADDADRRIVQLRPAANAFIDTVTQNGADPRTTVNIVPYSGMVNPGRWLFDRLGGQRVHEESSCMEFDFADFQHSGLPDLGSYAQVPHFNVWGFSDSDTEWMDWGWCPTDATAMEIMNANAGELKDRINTLRLHDGTGTYIGLKWGLAMLDPSTQPIISEMVDDGLVDEAFRNRPAPWPADQAEGDETLKVIVLMTDGNYNGQWRPSVPLTEADYVIPREEGNIGTSRPQLISNSEATDYFFDQCDLAKSRGVRVFTIAFDPNSQTMIDRMRACASSEADFFEVQGGLEIAEAFEKIGNTIQQLKLIGFDGAVTELAAMAGVGGEGEGDAGNEGDLGGDLPEDGL